MLQDRVVEMQHEIVMAMTEKELGGPQLKSHDIIVHVSTFYTAIIQLSLCPCDGLQYYIDMDVNSCE